MLRDLGILKFDEPFTALFNQGIVYKDGKRMSKSHGNVITQDEVANKYGIDSARHFLMFVASPDKDIEYNSEGVESSFRTVNRIFALAGKKTSKPDDALTLHKINKITKEVTGLIETFQYNLALIKLNELVNHLEKKESISKNTLEKLILLFSPFIPHTAEEMWEKIGNKPFASLEKWPVADESKISDAIEKAEQEQYKLVQDIHNILKIVNKPKPKKICIYVIPPELKKTMELKPMLTKEFSTEVYIFASNDKKKYDPEGKASKAKPGKPGIYIE